MASTSDSVLLAETLESYFRLTPLLVGGSPAYLVARRTDPTATELSVRWESDVTTLHGHLAGVPGAATTNLFCFEETDSIGIDEIHLTVEADGVKVVDDVFLGDFDDNRDVSLFGILPDISFKQSVLFTLREDDDGANGDDDILRTEIRPLEWEQPPLLKENRDLEGAGGHYRFRFNLSRGR